MNRYIILCNTILQVIQMFKGCKQEDMPPHVYAAAQMAYRQLLHTHMDQSILLMGRSGSGKTSCLKHIVHYLSSAAGSVGGIFAGTLNQLMFTRPCDGDFVVHAVILVDSEPNPGSVN